MAKAEETIDLLSIRKSGEQEPEPEDDLVPREVQLRIVYTDPKGVRHEGMVTSRILDADEKAAVGRSAAIMAGSPWDNFPPAQQIRMMGLATCAHQLRDPPDWLNRWIGVDENLLMTIYSHLERHTAFFFGADNEASTSAARPSRLVVTPQSSALALPE